ncbi:hypothetical protein MesoLjLc_09970 [Mesorhizobium sp. L-8-10]|uniref:hypothetical protein n=1 Tax=unclassified Mesorhizobium TaxID=325217 RepID=UPI0019294D07|nr:MULTISPECIES: hypothetical protein [unclassified Mesorhizobium]BCH21225.1 hypothetical protein MesoLjLb_10100 [Mesorhizobium sp. L-8-3]BCH29067.1 hypothetical protein MesoLjLc_09970 [Mesorhizobium sp. L-8-10]
MTHLKALLFAGAVALLATAPSFAQNFQSGHQGQLYQVSRSAPGPVAALGLPAAALVGGYVWLRRRSGRGQSKT